MKMIMTMIMIFPYYTDKFIFFSVSTALNDQAQMCAIHAYPGTLNTTGRETPQFFYWLPV